jgi:hypothetical protein
MMLRCRLALVAYELTGQLLGGEVGSVTMFAIPQQYGQRSLEENFLQVGGAGGCPAELQMCTAALPVAMPNNEDCLYYISTSTRQSSPFKLFRHVNASNIT